MVVVPYSAVAALLELEVRAEVGLRLAQAAVVQVVWVASRCLAGTEPMEL